MNNVELRSLAPKEWSARAGTVIASSGTTGPRKLMLVTPEAMAHRANIGAVMNISERDVVVADLLPASLPETYPPLLAAKAVGAATYDQSHLHPGERIGDLCERLGATVLVANAGARNGAFWQEPPTRAPVRFVLFFGSALIDYVWRMARAWAPEASVGTLYGIREVGGVTTHFGRPRGGLVGRPLPGVEIEIREGRMLYVRSPGMASEYADGTPIADKDGWFRSGDTGWWDEEGRLHLDERFTGGRRRRARDRDR